MMVQMIVVVQTQVCQGMQLLVVVVVQTPEWQGMQLLHQMRLEEKECRMKYLGHCLMMRSCVEKVK